MFSIIITTRNEAKSLQKALKIIFRQAKELGREFEIIVMAPDADSAAIVQQAGLQNSEIKLIQDKGLGKPAALNLALSKAEGDILVFTDGDVLWLDGALKALLNKLNKGDEKVGAVSGQPVPLQQENELFYFWSKILLKSADKTRSKQALEKKYFPCSGYLYAVKREFLKFDKNVKNFLDTNLLAEDGYISQTIWNNGGKIAYAPKAKVMVKYPANFSDWKKQKIRTLAGYIQLKSIFKDQKYGRSFSSEAFSIFQIFSYVHKGREILWTICLIFARLYVWFLAWWRLNIAGESAKKIWQRVESTK